MLCSCDSQQVPCFPPMSVLAVIMAILKLKVQSGLMTPLTQSLIPLPIFPFFPHCSMTRAQPIALGPSHSQLEAQLSIEFLWCVNDKEMQCGAVKRSVWRSFFEIYQVLFIKSRLCKSPSTPSMTSLLLCALTPILPLWAAQPSMLFSSIKKRYFPTIPWRCGQCFLLPTDSVVYWWCNAPSTLHTT